VPVGANQSYSVDIQVVAATHVNLQQTVAEGLFREDLYYRLVGLQITLPALRERSDITQLIEKLHRRYCEHSQQIESALMSKMLRYSWPGNLRELDNFMRVACLMSEQQECLYYADLPEALQQQLESEQTVERDDGDAPVELQLAIEQNIVKVYQHCQGNITQAAKRLGISRNTLYRKLRQLKLKH